MDVSQENPHGLPLRTTEKRSVTAPTSSPASRMQPLLNQSKLSVGTLVENRYEILSEIGSGGMSTVFLAKDLQSDRVCALKQIRIDIQGAVAALKNQIYREVHFLERLSSEFFPKIYRVIDDASGFFVAMEYVEGVSLDRSVSEFGVFSEEKALPVLKMLCAALQYLHAMDPPIIFRDVKPSNVILKPDGKIKLIDFGIAKEYNASRKDDTVSLGTIGYASPEHFGGLTDARSDIYSFGATAFFIFTACSPQNNGSPLSVSSYAPEISNAMERIVRKCTAADPKDRFQDCSALLSALDRVRPGKKSPAARLRSFVERLKGDPAQKLPVPAPQQTSEPFPVSKDLSDSFQLSAHQTALLFPMAPGIDTNVTINLSPLDGPTETLPAPHDGVSVPPAVSVPAAGASYIFISYAHRDMSLATNVIRLMLNCGFRVWFDKGIDPGSEWAETITERILHCGYFIALVSKNYFESENCTDELNYSSGRVEHRLMIYLEDVALPQKYELRHSKIQAIHRYRYQRDDDFIATLMSAKYLNDSFFTDGSESVDPVPEQEQEIGLPVFKRVFAAYSLDDYMRYARRFMEQLEAEEVEVWHKMKQCTALERYADEANIAISEANRCVFFLSEALWNDETEMALFRAAAEQKNRNALYGIVMDNSLEKWVPYHNNMTIISCCNSEQLQSIVPMVLAAG